MPALRHPDGYLEEVSETGLLPDVEILQDVKLYEGLRAKKGVFPKSSHSVYRENCNILTAVSWCQVLL